MAPETPPRNKRQKVDPATPGNNVAGVTSSPSSSTPIISKTSTNKRVIPDTPGSPPVQVAASSPVVAPPTGASSPAIGTPVIKVPGMANGTTPSNNTVANAVAEAMKLANPHYIVPPPSIRRPAAFPSQVHRSPQNIIPQSPPKPMLPQYQQQQQQQRLQQLYPQQQQQQQNFGNFVQRFAYPLPPQTTGGGQIQPVPQLAYRPAATSMANSYSAPNRPRPLLARPTQRQLQPQMPPQYLQPAPRLSSLPAEGTPLRRLMDAFPHINEAQAIYALTSYRGHYEDAAAKLVEDPTFGAKSPFSHPFFESAQQPQQPNYGRPPPLPATTAMNTNNNNSYGHPPAPITTQSTKRTLVAPRQTIQQKYTHMNQQTSQNFPNTWPYNVIPNQQFGPIAPFPGPPSALTQFSVSPSRPVVTKKRKLVRGKSKHLDSDGDSFSESSEEEQVVTRDDIFDEKVLDFLNSSATEEISDISFTPVENVQVFCSHRPFGSLEEARMVELPPNEDDDTDSTTEKRGRGRRAVKKRGRNIGNRIVDGAEEVLAGYNGVDDLISECEAIGKRVREKLAKWSSSAKDSEDGALTLTSVSPSTPSTTTTDPSPAPSERDPDLLVTQPTSLPEDVALKDYQLIGVSWLHLLYKEGLSCILADEMGLGKTCQVIAFLGGLLERTGGQRGKHLVVVPSSTIENWLREFKRFCPSLVVEPYYGDQKTRAELRYSLESRKDEFHVIVTTYKLATGAKEDRIFLKRAFNFDVCIFDEGHMLKNSMSKQYVELMKLNANFRILLTGTPLQNNLTELISLLSFILPTVFAKNSEALKSIFKLKPTSSAGTSAALLSQQRITRAKTMMTPFVLRRRKIHVLKDLPGKTHRVEYCEMHPAQKTIYEEILQKQRDQIAARARGEIPSKDVANNVLMQLRKAASHPLLFRRIYTDKKIRGMAREIMKEDRFGTPEHSQEAIYEDMSYMWDFPLHKLCLEHASIQRFALTDEEWMMAGKVDVLKRLLPECKKRGDRVLLFSFFTMMLDILEKVLDSLEIQYMRLDGQTKVDERQDLIDQFHNEEDITVFLLSTKAGGFGINLACANVVIIFDGSFNPHDDKQAEDRAHRVGQTRDVTVIRLVVKDTIEEHILHLANTKLALDNEMSTSNYTEEEDEKAEREGEKFVARMLIGKNGDDTPLEGGSTVPSRVVTPAIE